MTIEIKPVEPARRKDYLSLLLLADPDEAMVDRYLMAGDMYLMTADGAPACEAVVMTRADGGLEIKNLATDEAMQRRGFARQMIAFVRSHCAHAHQTVYVGTSPAGVPFYQRLGFEVRYVEKDFFLSQYAQPIHENGELLRDMIYLTIEADATVR